MKKIVIFLFEGAELFEIASFTDVFGWNNVVGLKEFRDIKVETISYKESIKCTWGGELRAEKIITEDNVEDFFDYDVLIIPGGFGKANFFKDKNNKIFKKSLIIYKSYLSRHTIYKPYYFIVSGTVKNEYPVWL